MYYKFWIYFTTNYPAFSRFLVQTWQREKWPSSSVSCKYSAKMSESGDNSPKQEDPGVPEGFFKDVKFYLIGTIDDKVNNIALNHRIT